MSWTLGLWDWPERLVAKVTGISPVLLVADVAPHIRDLVFHVGVIEVRYVEIYQFVAPGVQVAYQVDAQEA